MKKILYFIFFFFIIINFSFSSSSFIKGVIKDAKTNENLIGATIIIKEIEQGTTTDINGNFYFDNISYGNYTIKVSYISYETKEINIIVNQVSSKEIKIFLENTSINISEVTVMGTKKDNTEISTISHIRNSNMVVSGSSSQIIKKNNDSDASDVIKRLPGVSIVNDKFIIVRGLSSRYNNVWINGSTAPSSDPDTRSFSFDLIPSSIIDNVFIYKSPSSEFPSDYSGGFVKISTIGIPDNDKIGFSYGTSFDTEPNTYFEKIYTQNENWSPQLITSIPNQSFSFYIDKKFNKNGNSTIFNYNYSYISNNILNNNYSIYDFSNDRPNPIDEFIDSEYKISKKFNILHNWTFLPKNNTRIDFKNFFNYIKNSSVNLREGREWYNDGRYIKSTELFNSNRLLYTSQLTFNKNYVHSLLDMNIGYSLSIKDDPDIRRYRYISENDEEYLILFGTNPDLSSLSEMNMFLIENMITSSLNYNRTFGKINFKTGLFLEKKWRNFNSNNFGYGVINPNSPIRYTTLPIDEIFSTNELEIEDVTSKSDSYNSSSFILSYYVNFSRSINNFDVSSGLRLEKDMQTLNSYRQGTSIPVNIIKDTLNLFPSANIVYNINNKNLIRTTYGMSINRPEFREMAPFYFVDFSLNAGIYGNEDIKPAYIHNYDLRYEFYPNLDETFNIGFFYKKFINPIEVVIRGTNPTQFSFDNIDFAYSYGVELETKKSLNFIGLNDFSMVGNISLIKSNIEFDRPLQGQSPYIINMGLYYSKNDFIISTVYNIIGKRIIVVGIPSPNLWESIPDIYEMPRNELNIMSSKKIKNFEIKLGLKDLFNQNIKYQQNINTDVDMSIYHSEGIEHFNRTQIIRLYRPGRQFILNISYKF